MWQDLSFCYINIVAPPVSYCSMFYRATESNGVLVVSGTFLSWDILSAALSSLRGGDYFCEVTHPEGNSRTPREHSVLNTTGGENDSYDINSQLSPYVETWTNRCEKIAFNPHKKSLACERHGLLCRRSRKRTTLLRDLCTILGECTATGECPRTLRGIYCPQPKRFPRGQLTAFMLPVVGKVSWGNSKRTYGSCR